MADKYAQLAFTDAVVAMQPEKNSRAGDTRLAQGKDDTLLLSKLEAGLIAELAQLKAQLKEQSNTQQQGSTLPEADCYRYPQSSGEGELPLIISGLRQLTPRIRAIELKHVSGDDLPAFTAGAHLAIPVVLKDGTLIHRHYSLCSNPNRSNSYEIAVLNEPQPNETNSAEGATKKLAKNLATNTRQQSGSATIHQHFTPGLRLNCSLPNNCFPLERSTAPVVLIAGGVGITPIKAMALKLISQQRDFSLHYCGRSMDEMAFSDRLTRQIGDKLHLYPADEDTKLNIAALLIASAKDTHFYFCGPQELIDDLLRLAQVHGIANSQLHFERFVYRPDNTKS